VYRTVVPSHAATKRDIIFCKTLNIVGNLFVSRLRWSRGKSAGLWYTSSRVQTRPKPSDFSGENILSTPSFGGEIKPSVPCRKYTACKRTQKVMLKSPLFGKILGSFSPFHCWSSLSSFQAWRTPGGGSLNVLITGPPSWGFDVTLVKASCKHLPAENTQP